MGRSELELDDHQKARTKDKDKDRERLASRDREDDNRDRDRTKEREKARDREKDKDRDRDKDKAKDRSHRDRDRDRARDRERDRRERDHDRDYERDHDRDRVRDRARESSKDLDKDNDRDRERARDKDDKDKKKERGRDRNDSDRNLRDADAEQVKERKKEKDKKDKDAENENIEREKTKEREKDKSKYKDKHKEMDLDSGSREKQNDIDKEMELGERSPDTEMEPGALESGEIEVKEKKSSDAKKGKSEGRSEILDWVSQSRKQEEQKKIEERIKAARMARLLMEQDAGEDSEDEDEKDRPLYSAKDLAGLKVLHGVDKVMGGGAVVLTLKDRSILDGDDINNEIDELENLEIAQQKARDEAYKASKKKTGVYEDKFQNDIGAVRTILPQYDDEIKDAPMELDETGGLNEDGLKRLEELKKKLQGLDRKPHDSLTGGASVASDFYTQDEMLQFNKPKKKKKLRKKEKLDLDAMAAEARAAAETMGEEDHGSRSSSILQAKKIEQSKAEEESRKAAYLSAYSKALDASQRLKSGNTTDNGDDNGVAFGAEEDDELYRSLQRARQAALKKHTENGGASVGPQAVAIAIQQSSRTDIEMKSLEESTDKEKGNTVVFTDTEEFCRSLQLDERRQGTKVTDVFAEDDEPVNDVQASEPEGGWAEVNEEMKDVEMQEEAADDDSDKEDVVQETPVGKGLSGALQLLKDRGALKETVEWGGRNMDKKKSKLVGIADQEEKFRNREIVLDRVDEFGRTMTPKEAFRKLSHKFHGKGPGKMKQEKRMKQYEEEMKLKQMSSGDTPRLSMEKMREAQAKMHTPYIVISGHIKPGQTSDPRSGFATVEKESVGSLTPMLGDKKVEHFLGIKRRPEGGSMKPPLPKKSKEDTV